jgi:hypothetical protein
MKNPKDKAAAKHVGIWIRVSTEEQAEGEFVGNLSAGGRTGVRQEDR